MNAHEHDEDTIILLMMKAIDGRYLEDDERKQLDAHLKENPERATEFAQFSATATFLNDYRERKLYEHHNRTQAPPTRGGIVWAGLGLMLLGLGLLWAFALGPSLIAPDAPAWLAVELGAGVAVVGALALGVALLRR